MIAELLKNISKTVDGYPVKNLKYKQLDNIIIGMVKCPIIGNEKIHDGYICCQWRKNGKPTNTFKGREDLILIMNYED